MRRDVAIRIDGMLFGVLGNLDGIARHLKNNLPPDEFEKYVQFIGSAMGAITNASMELHSEFPDIVPDELKPSQM